MTRYRITVEFDSDYTDAYTELLNIARATNVQGSEFHLQNIEWEHRARLGRLIDQAERETDNEHLARKDTVWTRLARRIVRAGSS